MKDRELFEKWVSAPPFERKVDRYSMDEEVSAWPGQYKDGEVEMAWLAWEEAIKTERDANDRNAGP